MTRSVAETALLTNFESDSATRNVKCILAMILFDALPMTGPQVEARTDARPADPTAP